MLFQKPRKYGGLTADGQYLTHLQITQHGASNSNTAAGRFPGKPFATQQGKAQEESIMAITLILVSDAIIASVWILCERKARIRRIQAANGKRLADVIAQGQIATYYTPALSPAEIAELNAETWPD